MKNLQGTGTQVIESTFSSDLYGRFIAYLDCSENTVNTYRKAIKHFAEWMTEKGITTPQRDDIISYREELKVNHKPTTVQLYLTAVKLFFSWLASEGLYPNIADHVKGVKVGQNHKKDYLTSTQVKQVMAGIEQEDEKGLRDYAMFTLMITSGLRTVEVSRANIEDLRIVGDSTVLYIQGKGRDDKNEFVKVMPEVETALRNYFKARGKVEPVQPLFASTSNNSRGGRMTTRSISKVVKEAFKSAGYDSDRLTAHSTRHTAVTLALLGGESLQEVQKLARHSNINTTQIYAHNLNRMASTCERTIANAIFG